jgi:hypothetical protein
MKKKKGNILERKHFENDRKILKIIKSVLRKFIC